MQDHISREPCENLTRYNGNAAKVEAIVPRCAIMQKRKLNTKAMI